MTDRDHAFHAERIEHAMERVRRAEGAYAAANAVGDTEAVRRAANEVFAANWCLGFYRNRQRIVEEEARVAAAPIDESEREFRRWYEAETLAMDEIHRKRQAAIDELERGKKRKHEYER
jgi:hypothetical protein